jgi:hypothetical protein
MHRHEHSPTVEFTVSAAEHPGTAPAIVRLRRCVKHLWRAYSVKVVSMKPITERSDSE